MRTIPPPRQHGMLIAFAVAVLSLALVVPLVPQQVVRAAPIEVVSNVNDSGQGSLRQAIANVDNGGTITFAAGLTGTIILASQLVIDKSLTITGPGAEVLTVSGNDVTRVLVISQGVVAEISGLTVSDGHTEYGGGVYINNGTLTLRNSVIVDNVATSEAGGGLRGGGIHNFSGTLTIENSTIANNLAGNGTGGGIHNEFGPLTITNSTISGNQATGSVSNGAGIYNTGLLTITNSTFSGNTTADDGGAIYHTNIPNPQQLIIRSSTFAGNAANQGAGIYVSAGSVELENTIIANTPFSNNNCLVFNPSNGSITSQGYNLASDDSCNLTEATDQPGTDPLLDALANNGGPTWTHAFDPASPAWNAGGAAPCDTGTDQRGSERPQFTLCDIGAFELDVLPEPPTLTLPDAITAEATGAGGAVVAFADDVSATDWRDTELEVTCLPPSGTPFTIGTETVECSATDIAGQTTTDDFDVTVVDTTAPDISVPGDMTVTSTSPDGAIVDFAADVSATDLVDPAPAVNCTPPSGSIFTFGTTEVSCTATDDEGNASTAATFNVTVIGAEFLLAALIEDVRGSAIPTYLKPRLLIFLDVAERALDRGETAAACHTLALFSSQVDTLSPRFINPALANQFIADTQQIRTISGC